MKRLVSIAVCFITIISIAITNINAKTTTVYYGFYGSETTVFKKKGNKLTVKVRSPIDYYKKNRLFTGKTKGKKKTFKLSKKIKYYNAEVDNHMRLYNPKSVKKGSLKKIKNSIKDAQNDYGECYIILVVKNGVATKVVCCFS